MGRLQRLVTRRPSPEHRRDHTDADAWQELATWPKSRLRPSTTRSKRGAAAVWCQADQRGRRVTVAFRGPKLRALPLRQATRHQTQKQAQPRGFGSPATPGYKATHLTEAAKPTPNQHCVSVESPPSRRPRLGLAALASKGGVAAGCRPQNPLGETCNGGVQGAEADGTPATQSNETPTTKTSTTQPLWVPCNAWLHALTVPTAASSLQHPSKLLKKPVSDRAPLSQRGAVETALGGGVPPRSRPARRRVTVKLKCPKSAELLPIS